MSREAEANWVVKREKTVFQASQALGSVEEYDLCCHSLGIPFKFIQPETKDHWGVEGTPHSAGPAGAYVPLACSELLGLSTGHKLASA